MNTSYFIARRFFKKKGSGVSGPAIKIAVFSITLGIAVMILSVCIVEGFKSQISEKVTGFGAHIQISRFDLNQSYEPSPLFDGDSLISDLEKSTYVKNVSGYGMKPGIARSGDVIEGIVLKGVNADYDWSFFKDKLVRGSLPSLPDSSTSNDILISLTTANRLELDTGSSLVMYFVQQPFRVRKFNVGGIFNSGLEEMDRLYFIGDIRHVRKLNDWQDDQYSGIEITVKDFDKVEEARDDLLAFIPPDIQAQTIREKEPQIFDWLNLQDTNEVVILTLVMVVAVINMITALLILILDKTTMIGILKSLGMRNSQVRNIFLIKAGWLIGRGLLWGNMLGLGAAFLQLKTGLFTLDEQSYYLSVVPIEISLVPVLLINAGTFVLCMLVLLIPSLLISRINPVNAIRFS